MKTSAASPESFSPEEASAEARRIVRLAVKERPQDLADTVLVIRRSHETRGLDNIGWSVI